MTLEKEHARRMIDAHELAATRAKSEAKRRQHLLAARLLRQAHGIPEPVSFDTGANREAQRAEQNRINQWKQSR